MTAHAMTIASRVSTFFLDKPPSLDPVSLQSKMTLVDEVVTASNRTCFSLGLRSLGYKVTSLQACVVRGLEIDAPRPMLHMVLRVDLSDGPFLADVGFGNLAPTTALKLFSQEDRKPPTRSCGL